MICPTCNRKIPVAKGLDKKLAQDLSKARAAIHSLEMWQHWPGDGPNQMAALDEANLIERIRLNRALTDPKLLWSIYRRNHKGGYHVNGNNPDGVPSGPASMSGNSDIQGVSQIRALTYDEVGVELAKVNKILEVSTMEHLSTNLTEELIGVAAGEQADAADATESRNVAIANDEITERAQDTSVVPPPYHTVTPEYAPQTPLVTHVCVTEPGAFNRHEILSMNELRNHLSWCENPDHYITRIAAGEKVITDHVVYEPILAQPLAPGNVLPKHDPWLKDDPRVVASAEMLGESW